MLVLLDTGILLRLFERRDPNYGDIQAALKLLWARGDEPVIAPQNAVEYWNVSTRPESARGGFGQPVTKTRARLNAIERICRVLPESPATFVEWKRLVAAHTVVGVAVHDARVVAQMPEWCNVYDGLSDDESSALEKTILQRAEAAKICHMTNVMRPNLEALA